MKIIRFGQPGNEKPGLLLADGRKVDVSKYVNDYDEPFFAENKIDILVKNLDEITKSAPVIADTERLGNPLARPSKIICIGLNYADHAAESGMQVPKEPVIFFKATSAMSGPFDQLVIPKNSIKTDWEVELAVIIGKKASYVEKEQAMDYVFGYATHNDYSERAFQLERAGQWVKGKSCDTFAPMGPFIATRDEIANPQDLDMWLTVNGEKVQKGNTKTMVFDVATLVSYLSQFMSLLPGDVISTGTPPGVGLGFKPERYIKPGDVIECGIANLGTMKQTAVAYK